MSAWNCVCRIIVDFTSYQQLSLVFQDHLANFTADLGEKIFSELQLRQFWKSRKFAKTRLKQFMQKKKHKNTKWQKNMQT